MFTHPIRASVTSDSSVHADHPPAIAIDEVGDRREGGGFDYGSLTLEKAQAVRACSARIRMETRKTTNSAIAIGRDLIAAKAALSHGDFGTWLESECGFKIRTAQNLMAAARFADKYASAAYLPPGVLYRLSRRRTSPELRDHILERASRGERIIEAELDRMAESVGNSKARPAQDKTRERVEPNECDYQVGKSDLNARAEATAKRPGPGSVQENSRAEFVEKNSKSESLQGSSWAESGLSRMEQVEKATDWIWDTLGKGAADNLVFWHEQGMLDDILYLVREVLRYSEFGANVGRPEM